MLEIVAAGFTFRARFEEADAPGDRRGVPRDPARSRTGSSTAAGAASRTGSRGATASSASAPRTRPATRRPGQLLLYPGGISETELLFPYGHCAFGSKAGALAGNHFATVVEGNEHLAELGKLTLWEGAQPITLSGELTSASLWRPAISRPISSTSAPSAGISPRIEPLVDDGDPVGDLEHLVEVLAEDEHGRRLTAAASRR